MIGFATALIHNTYDMNENTKTAEERTAETVLEKTITVTLGKETYNIPRPTLGTIIEVSGMASKFGENEFSHDFIESPTEVLRLAKKYDALPRIVATFIVGVKKYSVFGIKWLNSRQISRMERKVRNNMTPRGMATILVEIFASMECAFFLTTITSLNKINHLKPTTTSPTASGQQ